MPHQHLEIGSVIKDRNSRYDNDMPSPVSYGCRGQEKSSSRNRYGRGNNDNSAKPMTDYPKVPELNTNRTSGVPSDKRGQQK